jgi:hypothetical protein
MPTKWHICTEGQEGNKKSQRRGLLVFSELPSLPSAGSRSGCFHTSLGCKPRSRKPDEIEEGMSSFFKANPEKAQSTAAAEYLRQLNQLTSMDKQTHHKWREMAYAVCRAGALASWPARAPNFQRCIYRRRRRQKMMALLRPNKST